MKREISMGTWVKSQAPNPKLQPPPIPNFQALPQWTWELGWELEVGSGWSLGFGDWDLTGSPQERLRQPPIHRNHMPRGLRALVAGEEQDRVGAVGGQDRPARDRAAGVELCQLAA